MKKTYFMRNKFMTLLAALLAAVVMTGCEKDFVVEEIPQKAQESQEEETPSGEGETDEVMSALAAIPGVSNVSKQDVYYVDGTNVTGYYFYVEQAVDHHNPAKGVFMQRCLLEYVSQDAPVMIYTNGYNLEDSVQNIGVHPIAQYLKANSLYVEYRYFGQSLPEDFFNLDFNYLYTDQAAADLHAVVTLMKQKFFTKGNKWVSTGTSKCGVNTYLYAYYSDLNGWDDIDLYMPFCAPMMTGTAQCPGDKAYGAYLINSCGFGYKDGSTEEVAYKRLREYPAAIASNKRLRDACLRGFVRIFPSDYIATRAKYPNDIEKAATAGVLYYFYDQLAKKFSYLSFDSWSKYVPDATAINDNSSDKEVEEVVDFIFMDNDGMVEVIKRDQATTRSIPDDEILKRRINDKGMPFYIQCARELGTFFMDFSLLKGGFITPAFADQVCQGTYGVWADYGERYQGQWDGAALMKSVRKWAGTTKKNILFVYGGNDPWTGCAVTDDEVKGNANVSKLLVPGGIHSHDFFNAALYDEKSAGVIKSTLDKYFK